MSRKVFCKKLNKELDGLAQPPYPGPKGIEIYESISAQAWQDWQRHQTMLINEKHLNMMDPSSRKYLSEQMDHYFNGDDYDKADGYIPKAQ